MLSSASTAIPIPDVVIDGPTAATSSPVPSGFTPAQLRQAYGFNQISFNNGTVAADGSGQTIAIITAYDQPNLAGDLKVFDSTLGIPAPPSFTKVNQSGGTQLPAGNASWGGEVTLDVEWAHGIAPGANILVVEANGPDPSDLMTAINYARNYPGVSVVSMSWTVGEFSSETEYDGLFTTPANHNGVTFVAASGDNGSSGAPGWPSVSPDVIAVGGTQLATNPSGVRQTETGWNGSGGGISAFEPQPAYQQGVVSQSRAWRTTPDVSLAATGSNTTGSNYAVYDTYLASGWTEGYPYGTSAGAPQWAGLIAIADQGRALEGLDSLDGPTQTLPALYGMSSSNFTDITSGNNGAYSAGKGYDLVTGLGAPIANRVVSALLSVANDTAINDPGFEKLRLPTGTFQYDPSGTPWSFAGNSGISANYSAFTNGNPVAPDGNEVAVLQENGSFSQTFTLGGAGSYQLSFYAAQRGNRNSGGQNFEVLLDGQVIGTYEPASTSYTSFDAAIANLSAGSHTLTFLGLDTAGGDNTAFLDDIELHKAAGGLLSDSSFEQIALAAGAYQYAPIGSPWVFSGASPSGSGVAGNNSAFTSGNTNAPDGNQVAFLQEYGTITQFFFAAAPGNAQLSFYAAQRGNRNNGGEDFEILLDGSLIGTYKPGSTSYTLYNTTITLRTAGSQELEFIGLNSARGDNTVFLDQIVIGQPAPILADSGFEQTQLAACSYQYNVTGSPWTFGGQSPSGSGVTNNDSGFTNHNSIAPEGDQVAFLQEKASISQTFDVTTTGSYNLSFEAAQRGNVNTAGEDFELLLDGAVIATFKPGGASYTAYNTTITVSKTGNHTIEFLGLDSAGGDNTVFLDQVLLT